MKSHSCSSLLVASGLALLCSIAVAAEDTANTIKFSDPSKPGTVKISIGRGDLTIHGADTTEVSVKSDAKAVTSKPRKDGLRVLSAASSFSLTEKDNTVTVESSPHEWGRGGGDFQLTVPRSTTVIVQNAWGGDIKCAGIAGDIEINSMHGEIRLDDVSGGVVVGTMNGEIRATVRELREGKPLSFTSMNGEVVVRVPDSAKANVRLRTQNGTVLTDFDESVLVTKTEAAPASVSRSRTFVARGTGGKVLSAEVEEAIREATRLSATAVKEALEAVKQGLEASRLNAEEARRELDTARSQMDRARRESDRERRVASARSGSQAEPAPPAIPAPPNSATPATAPKPPAVPKVPTTISGGKLVTGTLNGGGPEISVSTMNGDVILRKLERQ